MTCEVKKNLGELFREAIKNQPIQPIKNRRNLSVYKKSGIFGVSKVKNTNYKQGFMYSFKFIDKETGKQKRRYSKDLKTLYIKITEQGHQFNVWDRKQARSFFQTNCNVDDYNFFKKELDI